MENSTRQWRIRKIKFFQKKNNQFKIRSLNVKHTIQILFLVFIYSFRGILSVFMLNFLTRIIWFLIFSFFFTFFWILNFLKFMKLLFFALISKAFTSFVFGAYAHFFAWVKLSKYSPKYEDSVFSLYISFWNVIFK